LPILPPQAPEQERLENIEEHSACEDDWSHWEEVPDCSMVLLTHEDGSGQEKEPLGLNTDGGSDGDVFVESARPGTWAARVFAEAKLRTPCKLAMINNVDVRVLSVGVFNQMMQQRPVSLAFKRLQHIEPNTLARTASSQPCTPVMIQHGQVRPSMFERSSSSTPERSSTPKRSIWTPEQGKALEPCTPEYSSIQSSRKRSRSRNGQPIRHPETSTAKLATSAVKVQPRKKVRRSGNENRSNNIEVRSPERA